MAAFSGGVAPLLDRLSSLLKDEKLDSASAHAGITKVYDELKECYEAQERASPSSEYSVEQDEELRQACTQASLLFVARVLFAKQSPGTAGCPSNMGCPISKIVAVAGINLLDFFREVNLVVSKLSAYFEARGSSSRFFTQQAQLKENSETVVVLGLLAKKYKDNFNMFLHQLDFYKQVVLRLGWSAFLVLRVKLLSAFPDVVSCVELLPCIFAILVSHAPRLPDCLSHLTREDNKTALLKAMSEMCKADYNRVLARMPSVEALLAQILTTAVPEWRMAVSCVKCDARQPDSSQAAGPTFSALDLVSRSSLEGLVTDADRMQRALAALETEYEQHFNRGDSELDEREFLQTDFTKFASPRLSPAHLQTAMAKVRAGPMPLRQGALLGPGAHTTAPSPSSPQYLQFKMAPSPGFHSPLPMLHLGVDLGQPNTPVSEVMGASAWLRGVTASLQTEPSASLMRYLEAVSVPGGVGQSSGSAASAAAAQQLSRRVRDLVLSIMPDERIPALFGPFPLLQTSLAAERRTEVTKLYYHSLENILRAEEKASGIAAAIALLSAGKFHRALVACCVEVVAACYRMAGCAFPKVLDAVGIKAFDLGKMIQGFVKSVASLPRELKRHMFLIEEKILESLAWEPGSSLYNHILAFTGHNEAVVPTPAVDVISAEVVLQHAEKASGTTPLPYARVDSAGPEPPAEARAHGQEEESVCQRGGIDFVEEGIARTSCAQSSIAAVQPNVPPSPKRPQEASVSWPMSPAKKARGGDWSPQPAKSSLEKLPQSIGWNLAALAPSTGSAGALYDFCRKVLKLAAFRLSLMCDNFDFMPLDRGEVNAKVYETIEHALYFQTHLFYNRHIDQILLSALYGYCKVQKLSQVSFREIIAHYRKQPQAHQSIFRSVIIEQTNPGLQVVTRADIIAFYNQTFVPSMKSFLLKSEQGCPATNAPAVGAQPAPGGNIVKDSLAAQVSTVAAARVMGLPLLSSSSTTRSPWAAKGLAMPSLERSMDRPRSQSAKEVTAKATAHVADSESICNAFGADTPLLGRGYKLEGVPQSSGMPVKSGSPQGGGALVRKDSARSRSTSTVDHQIPDGLAALLQALDSQQGVSMQGGEDDMSDQELPGDGTMEDKSPRDRSANERRAARRFTERREAVKEDSAGTVENLDLMQSRSQGRRQRTPNRKYGV
uniref:Retinoblastoma-like protein n=1 Tax=Eudorina sp. 2006-703-Eu-15 TaxID=593785 RepID=N0DTY4_9CHLO|nr:retinoblastoma-like protein [Eudorina sp. 2006-703-Eu-15]BAN18537.1 retinoblastoma-like protein [Eudorina sp. 2006-703-Eu-15]